MYLVDLLALLLRRWVVVMIGLALTGAGAYGVLTYVEPDYQASGQLLLLLPPEATGDATPTSPFLNFESGISTAASLVAGQVGSKDTQRELAAEGHDAEYAVALAPEAGPLLVVTTKDKDPAVAVSTRDAVMERIAAELARIQKEARVPQRQLINADTTSTTKKAEVLPGSRMRALVGVAGVGALVTLLAAFGLDRLLLRRRTRRATAAAGDSGSDEDGEDGPRISSVGGGPPALAS